MVSRLLQILLMYLALIANAFSCDLSPNAMAGKLDYYNPRNFMAGTTEHSFFGKVTGAHLTEDMLTMTRKLDHDIHGDLGYTLKIFPNHPAALDLASRLEIAASSGYRRKWDKMPEGTDCLFRKALLINDSEAETYYVWGIHYMRNKKYPEAKEKFEIAQNLGAADAAFHYNYGLLYIKMEEYSKAAEQAKIAYNQGFPLPGLKRILEEKGFEIN